MKTIKLTQNKVVLVDDKDFEELNIFKWYAHRHKKTFYAERCDPLYRGKQILMHRQIMQTPNNMEVDHKDHNGLNCQRYNIRNCTRGQNQQNGQLRSDSTSGYKGVCWRKRERKWKAQIKLNGKDKWLGLFLTKEEAARAYNEAAKELFGEFGYLNSL